MSATMPDDVSPSGRASSRRTGGLDPTDEGFLEPAAPEPRRSYAWVGGVVLILLGLVFLGERLGYVPGGTNWWAFFILIPAVASAATALRLYRDAGGRVTAAVRGSVTSALALTFVALMFLFELSWSTWWPVFLIIAGVGALLGWGSERRRSP